MSEKDIWQDIKSGVLTAAEMVGETGKKAYQASRLALKEADLRRSLKDNLARLGRIYYKMEETETEPELEVVDDLMANIKALDEALEAIEEEKGEMKSVRVCPVCSRRNDKDAAFCSGCGTAL